MHCDEPQGFLKKLFQRKGSLLPPDRNLNPSGSQLNTTVIKRKKIVFCTSILNLSSSVRLQVL